MSTVTASCAFISFVLAYAPVVVKNPMLMRASKNVEGANYAGSPRDAYEKVVKASDESTASFLKRAQGCHNNQLECLPWFFGALLFAIVMGVPMKNIDAVSLVYCIARGLYNVVYLTGESTAHGLTRGLLFMACQIACMYLWVHAIAVAPKPNY